MQERTGLVLFKEDPMTLVGQPLELGQVAPDFTALNSDLSEFKLSDLDGKIKVISVVPSLDTGVCQKQTIRFNQEATRSDEVAILSISVDLPFAQKRFCTANDVHNLYTLSDYRDLDFGYKYGLVMKELRLLARAIIILDRNNVVQYIAINDQIAQEPNYDAALDVLAKLV